MKVLLSLLGAVTITSSSVGLVSSNVFVEQKHQENKLNDSTNQIDWKMVKENTKDYFDNLQTKQLLNSNFSQDKTTEIFNYAQEQSLRFIEEFSSQNLTIDEIINTISEKFPNFKENYNSKKLETQNDFYLFSEKTEKTAIFGIDYPKDLQKIVKKIVTAKKVFIGVTVAAGIAAAGFWAAAWWFGISIPWALACTTIAGTTAFVSTVLSEVIREYTGKSTQLTNARLAFDFLNWAGGLLFGTLVSAETCLAANIWALAFSGALIPMIGDILFDIAKYH